MTNLTDTFAEMMEMVDDLLPPPSETPVEFRLTRTRWEGLKAHFGEAKASNSVGFYGVPIVLDDTLPADEIRVRYGDGREEVVWPR